MILSVLLAIPVLLLALFPIVVFLSNLRQFSTATQAPDWTEPAKSQPVSVLIPARNEATGIATTLGYFSRSTHPEFEILVLDDASEDNTAEIVREWETKDHRIRLHSSPQLPEGWNGKQHACWRLAHLAKYPWLLFVDADVHVQPDAITRIVAEANFRNADLESGFPNQVTGSWSERMLIPMMHYILLCFLPLEQMRKMQLPSMAAGCGQLFLAKRDSYFACGGHSAIAASRHDGIQLPRLFRRNQLRTDLFDATDIASCRMYHNRKQVVIGLLKNATEGIANARTILPFTLLLSGASWFPIAVLTLAVTQEWSLPSQVILLISVLVGWIPRLVAVGWLRQSLLGALSHPIAVTWFLLLQWWALIRQQLGMTVRWRGRN